MSDRESQERESLFASGRLEEDAVLAALTNYRLNCPQDSGLADEAIGVYLSLRDTMPVGWFRPDGTPWATVGEQAAALRAAERIK